MFVGYSFSVITRPVSCRQLRKKQLCHPAHVLQFKKGGGGKSLGCVSEGDSSLKVFGQRCRSSNPSLSETRQCFTGYDKILLDCSMDLCSDNSILRYKEINHKNEWKYGAVFAKLA